MIPATRKIRGSANLTIEKRFAPRPRRDLPRDDLRHEELLRIELG